MAGIDEDAFLARLADVVRVPQANRARFFSEVRRNFKALHELERQLVHAPEIRSVGKIANELIRAILALDDEARSHLDRLLGGTVLLGQGMATSAFNPPSLPAKFTTTPRLLEFLNNVHWLLGSCEVMSRLPESNAFAGFYGVDGNSRSEGLKLRAMNYRRMFDLFLHVLAVDVQFAGGRFTIEKNIAGGTMIPALTLLRDEAPSGLLPVGLIPAQLSASTLQRRKTDWSKYGQRPTGTSIRSRGASEAASPATEARVGVYEQRKKRKRYRTKTGLDPSN